MAVFLPVSVRADRSFRSLFLRLFQKGPPSAEESALSPQVGIQPPLPHVLRALRSPFARKRLQAIDSVAQSGEANPKIILALVHAAQDRHPDVARKAAETLAGLCRAGHEEEVVRTLVRTLNRQPRVVHTDYAFKIPDPIEEQRVEEILLNPR